MKTVRRSPARVRWSALFAPLVCWVVVGCGKLDPGAVAPLSGQVLVNGKPARGVTVTFHPAKADAEAAKVAPSARTDDEGKFALTSFQTGDGAPPGDYKVTAVQYQAAAPRGARKAAAEGDVAPAVNVLPAKYSRAESTPLQLTVKPGESGPVTLDIKR